MSGQALLTHPKRAIVIPHPTGSKEAERIATTVREKLADEMEEMGVHGEVRVSMDGEHYEVLLRFHDAQCVSIRPGTSSDDIEEDAKWALGRMRCNIQQRVTK